MNNTAHMDFQVHEKYLRQLHSLNGIVDITINDTIEKILLLLIMTHIGVIVIHILTPGDEKMIIQKTIID